MDELEKQQQKSEQGNSNIKQQQASRSKEAGLLLGVKVSKLRADDEMRRIFGSRVVDAEARSAQAGGLVGGSRRVRRYNATSPQAALLDTQTIQVMFKLF